jgi:hypothetical protein
VRRIAGGTALAVALALAATACGATVVVPPPSGGLAEVTRPPSSAPSLAAGGTPVLGTLAPPSPAGDVIQDPSLLAILPADLGGVPVNLEAQAFADAAADPDFAANVDAAAFGVAVDGEDLASAVVAQLLPGTYSESFFRDWRDSYNEGACAQSGGVVGNAETQLGGRTVYIGTCAGGLHTYHAWLADRGAVVSAFSVGDRRFGEQLMAGLRP